MRSNIWNHYELYVFIGIVLPDIILLNSSDSMSRSSITIFPRSLLTEGYAFLVDCSHISSEAWRYKLSRPLW
jgi:hypothetical protein